MPGSCLKDGAVQLTGKIELSGELQLHRARTSGIELRCVVRRHGLSVHHEAAKLRFMVSKEIAGRWAHQRFHMCRRAASK